MDEKIKKILIIGSVIIVIVLFVIWILTRGDSTVEMSSEVSGEINVLLNNLKKETGIAFSDIHSTNFNWIVEIDPQLKEMTISGKGFEVIGISSQKYREIESFFGKENFQVNPYNIAAGTVSGLIGYKKDKIICVLMSGATGYKEAKGQWIPPEPNKKDADVKCGEFGEIKSGTDDSLNNWNTYRSKEGGYSFEYPSSCIYAYEELPETCQSRSLEELAKECQCYLYENMGFVSLQYIGGTKPDFDGAGFSVQRIVLRENPVPIPGSDFVVWLRQIIHYHDIPDKTNTEVDGIPAMRIRSAIPNDPSLFQDSTFFLKDDVLFNITTLDTDNEENQKLYNQIFSTFHF
jgi:hypothetical protein